MPTSRFIAAAALLATVVAGGAPARVAAWEPPPPPPSRLLVAVRVAGLRAGGSAIGLDNDPHFPTRMTELVRYAASIGGDAALKIGHGFAAGIYADLGFRVVTGDRGRAGAMTRAGLEALWERRSEESVRWWASLGAGYEWLSAVDFDYLTGTLSGFELCNLKAGADFAAGKRFTLGPYLGASVGLYRRVVGDVATVMSFAGYHVDNALENQRAHYWFSLGLSGTFEL